MQEAANRSVASILLVEFCGQNYKRVYSINPQKNIKTRPFHSSKVLGQEPAAEEEHSTKNTLDKLITSPPEATEATTSNGVEESTQAATEAPQNTTQQEEKTTAAETPKEEATAETPKEEATSEKPQDNAATTTAENGTRNCKLFWYG